MNFSELVIPPSSSKGKMSVDCSLCQSKFYQVYGTGELLCCLVTDCVCDAPRQAKAVCAHWRICFAALTQLAIDWVCVGVGLKQQQQQQLQQQQQQ
jgi:hypothetical protein